MTTTSARLRLLTAATTGLTLGVLLAGCGGSSAGDAGGAAGDTAPTTAGTAPVTGTTTDGAGDVAGAAPDPCSLVTAAELTTAYGTTFGEGAATDTDVAGQRGFRACTWTDAGGTGSFLLQTVASGEPLGQTAAELFDQSRDLYPDATDAGVGERSLLLPEGGGFLAVVGDVFVQGNAIAAGGTPDASTTVLQTVVANLD